MMVVFNWLATFLTLECAGPSTPLAGTEPCSTSNPSGDSMLNEQSSPMTQPKRDKCGRSSWPLLPASHIHPVRRPVGSRQLGALLYR